MKYDLIIKGGNLYLGKGVLKEATDIAILDGKIVAVGKSLTASEAKEVIDAGGKLVSPSFCDTHLHMDIAYTFDYETVAPSLIGGAKLFKPSFDHYKMWTKEKIYEEIYNRTKAEIDASIAQGTTVLKNNVSYMQYEDEIPLVVCTDLKEEYAGRVDLYNCVSFSNVMNEEEDPVFYSKVIPFYKNYLEEGKIDYISGYPHKHKNPKKVIDDAFELAISHDLPLDMHCDESDVPNLYCFEYILDKIIETSYHGKVTLGHVTALAARHLEGDLAQRLIKKAALADVNITSLTSCNLFLMNPSRRGPTRVRELLDAGVNVAVASDDIREILRPFGNCDMLEEALLTAKVHKMGSTALLRQAFDMATYNGARNCLLSDYGIFEGSKADLVILDAPTPEEALIMQAEKPYVFKEGKLVASYGKLV